MHFGVRFFIAAFAFTLCAVGVARAQEQPHGFVDSFAVLDESRWRIADGWSNGSWTANDWRRTQIRRIPSGIQITLGRNPGGSDKRFSSGELQSEDVYQYGYFETRMQAPRGSGLVTGFFTYTRPTGENSWDEIDIEILGRDTRSIQLTYFRNGQRHIETIPLGFDAAEGLHTYGFEWRPERIRWYVDGRMVHEENGTNGPIPHRRQRLYLHLWNTDTLTEWLGRILPWEGPWRLNVSCIAYAPTYENRSLCGEN